MSNGAKPERAPPDFLLLGTELLEVMMCTSEHPDRELELEVGIGDGDVLVEHALDRLLRP